MLTLDPLADHDGDGQSNGAEHTAGTNPLSSASVMKVTSISAPGNNLQITVSTVIGKTYQLQTSTDLTAPSWSNVGSPVTAVGAATVFTAPGDSAPKRFHRVKVEP